MPTLSPSQFKSSDVHTRQPERIDCPSPGCGTHSWSQAAHDSHVEKWHAPHFDLPQTLSHR